MAKSQQYFRWMAKMIDRIKNLCKKNKINISTLEKETGLSNGQIGKWKERQPRADFLYNIANYFNVSMEYLLTGKEYELKETEIISFYRKADDRGKDRIYKTAKDEAEQATLSEPTEQLPDPDHDQEEKITEFPKEMKPFA